MFLKFVIVYLFHVGGVSSESKKKSIELGFDRSTDEHYYFACSLTYFILQ